MNIISRVHMRSSIFLEGEFFKVAFTNVCGLWSEWNAHDFIDFISEYDMICVCESKLDDADVHNANPEGYKFISQEWCWIYSNFLKWTRFVWS